MGSRAVTFLSTAKKDEAAFYLSELARGALDSSDRPVRGRFR